MCPVFAAAKAAPARIVFAEGEDERVLRAAQFVLMEKIAKPIIVGPSGGRRNAAAEDGLEAQTRRRFRDRESGRRLALSEELAGVLTISPRVRA